MYVWGLSWGKLEEGTTPDLNRFERPVLEIEFFSAAHYDPIKFNLKGKNSKKILTINFLFVFITFYITIIIALDHMIIT